jgi:hypothetical protein
LLEQVCALAATTSDVLAMAYSQIVRGVNRRVLGTFFTPSPVVSHMLRLCQDLQPQTVIDPGAGVGAFSLAATTTWAPVDVLAVDVNVVTLGLLAAHEERLKSTGIQARLHLVHQDFLTWSSAIPTLPGPRLILGNPPYTRHQHMTAQDKQVAQQAAGPLVDSGLAGLSTYFLAACIRALSPEDSLCLLLPGNWCQARYGREARKWLWTARDREVRLQFFPSTAEVFPGTQVTAMILYVGPQSDSSTRPFAVQNAEIIDGKVALTNYKRVVRTGPTPPRFTRLHRMPTDDSSTLLLSDIIGVRRGVATGANQFFFMTDEVKETLPADVVVPALLRASHVEGDVLDAATFALNGERGLQRWLLQIPAERPITEPPLRNLLELGEHNGYHLRHLTSRRPSWYSVERVDAPDMFFSPFAHRSHRVISNETGAVASNNLYGIYVNADSAWNSSQLAEWLRSAPGQAALADRARDYQGHSHKLEPSDLLRTRIPAAPP